MIYHWGSNASPFKWPIISMWSEKESGVFCLLLVDNLVVFGYCILVKREGR